MQLPSEIPCQIAKFTDRYNELRKEYPNLIILFKHEDTYCTLDNDAILISNLLSIDMYYDTTRQFSDFPRSYLDQYITTLINRNQKVLIVSQSAI